MRIKVQGRLKHARFIEIHQVFAKKKMVRYFSNRVVCHLLMTLGTAEILALYNCVFQRAENMARSLRVEEVNSLGSEDCAKVFRNIVESFPQAAQTVCAQRPFSSADHIAEAAGRYLDQLPQQGAVI